MWVGLFWRSEGGVRDKGSKCGRIEGITVQTGLHSSSTGAQRFMPIERHIMGGG